ncbi:MAG: ATPase [Actinobacteria bacterium]|nr:ATPase [Actinomycetota bacterium]
MFSVPIPARLVNERTDLSSADLEHLTAIVEDWSLLADLSLSDLILWLPTWNDAGALAVAHVRPTTAPTSTPEDVIGTFSPRGRLSALDQALTFGRSVTMRDAANPLVPTAVEAYPIHRPVRAARSTDSEGESGRDRDVIGVVVRRASSAPRVAGQLEEFYLSTADILFAMLISGQFPVPETVTGATGRPRIGDGVVRLDSSGTVAYASPNAVSALRRLGLATDVVGADFSSIVTRLLQRHGAVDAAVADLARGRVAGRADIEGSNATVLVRSIPLRSSGPIDGAVLLLRDTTDIRRRERALLSKDATIREIHHRVKNNLQTVAALLRLQSRRSSDEAISAALGDAQVRVAAIAVVHEALSSDSSNETDLGESVEFDRIVRALFAVVVDDPSAGPTLETVGDAGRLPAETATPLAMCVSELVHNAVRHSRGTYVRVSASREPGMLRIEVSDDGTGFEATQTADVGLGLQIVQSLAATELGGSFEFTEQDYGTTAVVTVPI